MAGSAVLFSRQILNDSQDFFLFNTLVFIHFSKFKTIETHARLAFLTLIILAIGGVCPHSIIVRVGINIVECTYLLMMSYYSKASFYAIIVS